MASASQPKTMNTAASSQWLNVGPSMSSRRTAAHKTQKVRRSKEAGGMLARIRFGARRRAQSGLRDECRIGSGLAWNRLRRSGHCAQLVFASAPASAPGSSTGLAGQSRKKTNATAPARTSIRPIRASDKRARCGRRDAACIESFDQVRCMEGPSRHSVRPSDEPAETGLWRVAPGLVP
jgi:hypothetical protein